MQDMTQFASPDSLAVRSFKDRTAMELWLEVEHDAKDGTWIALGKKASGVPSVTYSEAVEVALCFGWIDGQRRALDETHFLQRFTPRRLRSSWSQVNRKKVEALITAGRMRPSGQKEIDRAKDDGRWDDTYDGAQLSRERARSAANKREN